MTRLQLLHWVVRTGNLKKSIDFYRTILGMRVLRHEEFSAQCEAQCNGAFARPWSKTMVGYGPEDEEFVFELTFNYGIVKYEQGHDVKHFIINDQKVCEGTRILLHSHPIQVLDNAKSANYPILNENTIVCPDGYCFHVQPEPSISRRCLGVRFYSGNLASAQEYYTSILGMTILQKSEQVVRLGYSTDCFIEIEQSQTPIHHTASSGRLAIAVPNQTLSIYEDRLHQSKDKIHTPRVALPTPGKATVEVIILLDRDGFEICLVGGEAFFELCAPFPGCDNIVWEEREANGSRE